MFVRNAGWWLAVGAFGLAACTMGDTRQLVLDGPPSLRTDALGPVTGPVAMLSDGSPAEGLQVAAEPGSVATVDGTTVTAVGAGEATVTASWQGQSVQWTLVVDPAVQLRLVSPPATLTVGQRQPIHLEARMGDAVVDPGEVSWQSSDAAVLTVSAAGEAVGVAPGTAYVVVTRGASEAMAEVQVVDAP